MKDKSYESAINQFYYNPGGVEMGGHVLLLVNRSLCSAHLKDVLQKMYESRLKIIAEELGGNLLR